MSSTKKVVANFYVLVLVLFLFLIFFTAESKQIRNILPTEKVVIGKGVPATILVFGDSTADPGNNNYINTPLKANFPPYGEDFMQQSPTGRFTNGKLPNDYIAEYLGIKEYVPPYLDPTLSIEELISGVSFASAGSGFDPLTPKITNVIPVSQQLEYFKEYKSRIAAEMGEEKAENVLKDAFYFVSAGTNDFVINYFTVPIRREHYTISTYVDFCLQNVKHFLQELLNLGARRIGVVGLPPMGCMPIVITLNSNDSISNRGFITNLSTIAQFYNEKLRFLPESTLAKENPNTRIGYIDIFDLPAKMIAQARNYGFEDVASGCCGTGFLEFAFLCNPNSYICPDTSKYLFFDSLHPTERVYNNLFQAFRPKIDSILHG